VTTAAPGPGRPRSAPLPDPVALAEGVIDGDRASVARAITLVESSRASHQAVAHELLLKLLPHAGQARRVGVSGVPGAGKSTFIDALGVSLVESGRSVAVLAVDPSSARHGGSILGDKTRMTRLSVEPTAFIRPSPTSGTLGGVARATRQAIVVVEAAGFDVVIVETVGVGQSETAVSEMVDTFLLLMVARTGDSLQGIKRGVLELANVIAVNKADGDRVREARRAAAELTDILRLMEPTHPGWRTPVLTCSALEGTGVAEVWEQVEAHRESLESGGLLQARRAEQEVAWMWTTVRRRVLDTLVSSERTRARVAELEADVRAGRTTSGAAADQLLEVLADVPAEST
jgi:LAO/AO transport system kinase